MRCGAGRRLLRWRHGETAQTSLSGRVVPHHREGHGGSGGGEGVRKDGREAEDGQAAAEGTRPRMPGY